MQLSILTALVSLQSIDDVMELSVYIVFAKAGATEHVAVVVAEFALLVWLCSSPCIVSNPMFGRTTQAHNTEILGGAAT